MPLEKEQKEYTNWYIRKLDIENMIKQDNLKSHWHKSTAKYFLKNYFYIPLQHS